MWICKMESENLLTINVLDCVRCLVEKQKEQQRKKVSGRWTIAHISFSVPYWANFAKCFVSH